jgi:hypothetical protein
MSLHLDTVLKDIERVILKESLIYGKGSVEYDISSVPIPVNSKVSNEKPTDAELNTLIAEVLLWLRKENLTVKQQFERSMCANLRTKMTISWSNSSNSNYNSNTMVENDNQQFERALPVLMTFPLNDL